MGAIIFIVIVFLDVGFVAWCHDRCKERKLAYGFRAVWDDGFVTVSEVLLGGPAARAGIKPGDVILKKNGKKLIPPFYKESLRGARATIIVGNYTAMYSRTIEAMPVTYTVLRDEIQHEVKITPELIYWPQEDDRVTVTAIEI